MNLQKMSPNFLKKSGVNREMSCQEFYCSFSARGIYFSQHRGDLPKGLTIGADLRDPLRQKICQEFLKIFQNFSSSSKMSVSKCRDFFSFCVTIYKKRDEILSVVSSDMFVPVVSF